MMVVCPVCGDSIALVGEEDETYATEIVMRRGEGERIVRISFTRGPFTDETLHTCDPSAYARVIPWNSGREKSIRPDAGKVVIDWYRATPSPLAAPKRSPGRDDGWTIGSNPEMDSEHLANLLREIADGVERIGDRRARRGPEERSS